MATGTRSRSPRPARRWTGSPSVGSVPLSARVVEVIADRGGGQDRFSYGSGCIVAGRTVLTSAHVIEGGGRFVVRTTDKREHSASLDHRFVGDPGGWQQGGSAAPDVALLTMDDEGVDLPPLSLARIDRDHRGGGPLDRVRVIGYPWFAKRTVLDTVRTPVEACGQIPLLSHVTEGLFSLTVTIGPPPPAGADAPRSQWSGMSGAPVLAGGRLVGVVCEHGPREGDSTITFVPLTALEPDPGRPLWGPGVGAPGSWWARLGVERLDELAWLPPPVEAPYRATLRRSVQALHDRMPVLVGRERELEEISTFAIGDQRYRWLLGGAFAGKSALLLEAVTAGLPDQVDVVCYFLSRRASDASADRFLQAVVPQLEVLCDIEPGSGSVDRDRFNQLWQRAEQRAVSEDRHLLLVIDGLDEDLQPPGQPLVASLVPRLDGGHSHVLVSSRPHPELQRKLNAGHPLAQCTPVDLAPFEGAVDLADLARKEIDALTGPEVSDLAATVLGLVTAAAGPLSVHDLACLSTGAAQPSAIDRRNVRKVLRVRAARSLEEVGDPDRPRYQFAHVDLLDHARDSDDLSDPEWRDRIHRSASRWHQEGWPIDEEEGSGTPSYFFDTYPTMLAGDTERPIRFPPEPDRLNALVGEIGWVVGAIGVIGVDRVLADLRAAAATAEPADPKVAGLLAVTTAQAPNLRPPAPITRPNDMARQLCLQALEHGRHALAETARQHLLAAGDDGPLPAWTTVSTVPPLLELGEHDTSGVQALAVLGDGRVVSGDSRGRVWVWSVARPGNPIEIGTHDDWVRAVASLGDGRVVSGGHDGRVLVWDPDLPEGAVELGTDSVVWALAPLGDGRVVSGSPDGRVQVWDPDRPGTPIDVGAHGASVMSVMSFGDGRVVSGGGDGRVLVWSLDQPGAPTEVGSHRQGSVLALASLRDGRVVSGGADGWLRVWDPDRPGDPIGALTVSNNWMWAVALLGDGRVVAGGADGRIWVWDPDRSGELAEIGAHDGGTMALAALGDGRVVSGGSDGRLRAWDPTHTRRAVDHRALTALALLGDGRVVSGGDDGRVLLWDPDQPDDPVEIGTARADLFVASVFALAPLPDGRVVSGDNDGSLGGRSGRVRVWDPDRPGDPVEVGSHDGWVRAVASLGDGRVVSGGDDGRVRVWDPDRLGDPVEVGSHDGWVFAVASLGDGRVVSGGQDGRVLLWDLDGRGEPAEVGTHRGWVRALASMGDGRVVSGHDDGRLRIWDPGRLGDPVEVGSHEGWIKAVVSLGDGRLVSGDSAGRVWVWDPDHPNHPMAQIACPVSTVEGLSGTDGPGTRIAIGHDELGLSVWTVPDTGVSARL